MAYACQILLDSINPTGNRLTTFQITYPRFVHSEFMTHRVFSRNSASSRAIPVAKMIEAVENDPVMPVWWGKNESGMQAKEELCSENQERAKQRWLDARSDAVHNVKNLMSIGLHKQIANRILEPWMWITVIASATELDNFFALRCHPDAQPEIQRIAYMMHEVYSGSTAQDLAWGEWHVPFPGDTARWELSENALDEAKRGDSRAIKISTGKLTRVSFLTHEGKRDFEEDIALHDRILKAGHMSPFEHCAFADKGPQTCNFKGFTQYRKMIPGEAVFTGGR